MALTEKIFVNGSSEELEISRVVCGLSSGVAVMARFAPSFFTVLEVARLPASTRFYFQVEIAIN